PPARKGKKGGVPSAAPQPPLAGPSAPPAADAAAKKPGFLARLWGGGGEVATPMPPDPAPPLSKAERRRLERLQAKADVALGADKKAVGSEKLVAPQKVAEVPEKKSFWNRVRSWGSEPEAAPAQ